MSGDAAANITRVLALCREQVAVSSSRLIDAGPDVDDDADMTDTMQGAAMTTTARAVPDEPPPIPFQSLDRLARVRAQIDEQVSSLLGRLTPYVSSSPTRMLKESPGPEHLADSSPLEDRIAEEIASFQEIAARLEELIGDLRL